MGYIPRIADLVTILAGGALLVVVLLSASRGGQPSVVVETEASHVGRMIDARVGIDFAAERQTLIMALASDCPFCDQSTPFYRRLVDGESANAQIVVAAQSSDTAISRYLSEHDISPDGIVLVEPGVLPVMGTPTLLLVDDTGVVTDAWIGRLTPDREAEVIDRIGP